MFRRPYLALAALLALAAAPLRADLPGSVLGQGDDGALGVLKLDSKKVTVGSRPDAHWKFESSGRGQWVANFSVNLDGIGFDNQSKCYGHSLLATRWFQYVVKPLKAGTISKITPQEFKDFWGGRMDYPPNYDITPANVDGERLRAYSMYDDKARAAIGKLVGYYYRYQSNLFDHGDETYDSAERFSTGMWNTIARKDLPIELGMRRSGGGHSVLAYKMLRGTAMFGNREGREGERREAYKICFYDPNYPASGKSADDAAYEDKIYMIVFEGSGGHIGFSEELEWQYDKYLKKTSTPGMWEIPRDKVELFEDVLSDEGSEIRSWHWSEISDAEGRRIAGLDE